MYESVPPIDIEREGSFVARDLIDSTPTIQFVSSSFQMLNEELAGTLVLDKPNQNSINAPGISASGDHDGRLAALASGLVEFSLRDCFDRLH